MGGGGEFDNKNYSYFIFDDWLVGPMLQCLSVNTRAHSQTKISKLELNLGRFRSDTTYSYQRRVYCPCKGHIFHRKCVRAPIDSSPPREGFQCPHRAPAASKEKVQGHSLLGCSFHSR